MSAYDSNHNDNAINYSPNTSSSNQVNRFQVDNDFISRGFSSTQQTETSFQLTRPTSKTAMMVRQRRAGLEQLHNQLSCRICKGYLIDAMTIDECMDSFCKSCIVTYLTSYNNCPKCGVLLDETNPLSHLRSDKVLQDIVYKLVPGLYDKEMRRRRNFYKNLYEISSSSSSSSESSSASDDSYENNEEDHFTGSFDRVKLSGEQYGVISHPKPFYKPSDNIDLSIEPYTIDNSSNIYYDNRTQSIVTCFTSNFQSNNREYFQNFSEIDGQEFKTYLRCPAKFTAQQLKKFIAVKFNVGQDDTINILYLNESLNDRYTLIDIAYIYDWRGIEHMRLFYKIERDIRKLSNLKVSQQLTIQQQSSANKNKIYKQSVGTSTQNNKRVCIEQKSNFDDESQSNSNSSNYFDSATTATKTLEAKATKTIPSDHLIKITNNNNHRNFVTTKQTTTIEPNWKLAYGQKSDLSTKQKTYIITTTTSSNNDNQKISTVERNKNQMNVGSQFKHAIAILPANIRQQQGRTNEIQESRLTKKVVGETSGENPLPSGVSNSVPKININLSSLYQNKQNVSFNDRNVNNYNRSPVNINNTTSTSRQQNDLLVNNQHIVGTPTTVRQLIPYYRMTPYPASTTTNIKSLGPSQSSLVTLSSFTQAKNNQIVAMSSSGSSSATTYSKNIIDPKGTTTNNSIMIRQYQQQQPNMIGVNNHMIVKQQQQLQTPNSTPQLAFSFVTERGITIVRRMNSQEEAAAIAAASSAKTSSNLLSNATPVNTINTKSLLALPAPSSQSSTSAMNQQLSYEKSPIKSSTIATTSSFLNNANSSNQSDSNINDIESNSKLNQIKSKPIYKTMVDPTKLLRPPNYKKFGNNTAKY